MTIRNFALVYGVLFLIVGIAGFIPAFVAPLEPGDPNLGVTAGAGRLFGLFPVNVLHNIVHLAFGVWGLAVYKNTAAAITYARAVTVVYSILVLMGLFPVLQTTFGLVPLHSHDIWLHLLLAAGAAYFGYVLPRQATTHVPRGA